MKGYKVKEAKDAAYKIKKAKDARAGVGTGGRSCNCLFSHCSFPTTVGDLKVILLSSG